MKNPLALLLIGSLLFLFVPVVHATANSTGGILITSISAQNFSGLPNKDFDGTFTVMNNGTLVQNIRISQTGLGSLEVTFAPEKFDLGVGQSQSIHFDIESDANDEDLFRGTIIAQSDATHKDFFSLSINLSTEGFAAVTASDVFLGRIELNNGTNTTGFYPGQLVELELFFENNYRKSTDPVIESFRKFEVFFEDFSEESTTDFEPEFGDLSLSIEPASIQSIKSKQFRIPFDTTNNRSYKLQLDIEAEDSENRVFPINYTSFIVVDREKDRVGFSRLQLSRDKLACGEKLTVDLTFVNVGEFPVRDAYFALENNKLNLSYDSKRYQLSAQESDRRQDYVYEAPESVTVTIPRNAAVGAYALTAKTYIGSEKSETESHFFDIVSCSALAPASPATNPSTNTQAQTTQNQSAQRNVTTTSTAPFSAASSVINTSRTGTANTLSIDSVDTPLNTRTIAITASVVVILLLILLLSILIFLLSKRGSSSSRAVSVISVRKNGEDNAGRRKK